MLRISALIVLSHGSGFLRHNVKRGDISNGSRITMTNKHTYTPTDTTGNSTMHLRYAVAAEVCLDEGIAYTCSSTNNFLTIFTYP